MDEDLDRMSRRQLIDAVKKLRKGVREHRDSTRHELCWHHPALWGLLPERTDPVLVVPDWQQFLEGCLKHRRSLDEQAPGAPRTNDPYRGDMSIENTRERKVRPTHPGEMLREDFLPDYGLTASTLARAVGVSRQTIHQLLRGRRAASPEMAIRLARLFGNTPEFWLDAQRSVDLWDAAQSIAADVKRIKPMRVA